PPQQPHFSAYRFDREFRAREARVAAAARSGLDRRRPRSAWVDAARHADDIWQAGIARGGRSHARLESRAHHPCARPLVRARWRRRAAARVCVGAEGLMAEGVRFELTRELAPPAGFQDRCLKPLGHPSEMDRADVSLALRLLNGARISRLQASMAAGCYF